MNISHWIWYPGDFEVYHGMLQNFSREERDFIWPAYYHLDDCRKHVRFTREYDLKKRGDRYSVRKLSRLLPHK